MFKARPRIFNFKAQHQAFRLWFRLFRLAYVALSTAPIGLRCSVPACRSTPYTSSEQDLKLPLCFEEQVWVPSSLTECSTGATFVPRCTSAVKQATEPRCVCSIILHAPSFSVISCCACIQLWKSKLFRAVATQSGSRFQNSQMAPQVERALALTPRLTLLRPQVSYLVGDRAS
jgi:hypothetical protein